MKATLLTDGACKGNPGPTSIGIVLRSETGQTIDSYGKFTGQGTNNTAEYTALKIGLERALKLKVTDLQVCCDSKILVDHVNNRINVTQPRLTTIMRDIRNLISKFESIHVKHVPRKQNAQADLVANLAYQQELNSVDY